MSPDDYTYNPDFADFYIPTYVVASVTVPISDEIRAGRATGRKQELDGTALGAANTNPMLDTRIYEIEFLDGRTS
jgi:hypothetical protein